MSSVHGHRAHTVTTRSSPARRGRSASIRLPVGVARSRAVAPTTRSSQNATSATRQSHQVHTSVAATLLTRRNTVASVAARVVRQNSVAVVEEVVDLTCNSPHRATRRAQPPVVLGGGARARVPATRSKPTTQHNLRSRQTAAAPVVAVSPSKKLHSVQDLMCPVCFEDLDLTNAATEKPVFSTNCGHLFCKPCILACLEKNPSCPICRKFQSSNDVHPIYVNEKF